MLVSKNWDVRTAASVAMERILSSDLHIAKERCTCTVHDGQMDLEWDDFDLAAMIDTYEPLVASSGSEFELDLTKVSSSERMKQMRGELQKTL